MCKRDFHSVIKLGFDYLLQVRTLQVFMLQIATLTLTERIERLQFCEVDPINRVAR